MKHCLVVTAALILSACSVSDAPEQSKSHHEMPAQAADPSPAPDPQSLSFPDVADKGPFAESPVLKVQVALDRLGFSPGVIDGEEGASFRLALRGFQASRSLPGSGKLDAPTREALAKWSDIKATRLVSVPPAFAKGPFIPDLPKGADAQAKLSQIGYRNIWEALAERFHTTPDVLARLNPSAATPTAGSVLRVPAISNVDPRDLGPDDRGWNRTLQTLGVAPGQPLAEKVVVKKLDGVLQAFDKSGKLIAQFPATMGSRHDPLPIGHWKIQGISRNPDFHYNPRLFWDAKPKDSEALLKPGPNGPVGVVWLDLSKPHYGIHGTSEPQTIGRAESHGCVRLTNWDAARLAQMVRIGTPAVFMP